MTAILRHEARVREEDGAVHYSVLMSHFESFRDPVATWTFKQWKDCLTKGTDKIRFDYWPNRYGRICYLRTIPGHPGTERIDPQLWSSIRILHNLTPLIYHVGSFRDLQSNSRGWLIGGGRKKCGRQTYFFTVVYPLDILLLEKRRRTSYTTFLQNEM